MKNQELKCPKPQARTAAVSGLPWRLMTPGVVVGLWIGLTASQYETRGATEAAVHLRYAGGIVSETVASGTASVNAAELPPSEYPRPAGQVTASSSGRIAFGVAGSGPGDPNIWNSFSLQAWVSQILYINTPQVVGGWVDPIDVTFVFRAHGYIHSDPLAGDKLNEVGSVNGLFSVIGFAGTFFSVPPQFFGSTGDFGNSGLFAMEYNLLGADVPGILPGSRYVAAAASGYVDTGAHSITYRLIPRQLDWGTGANTFAFSIRLYGGGDSWGSGSLDFMNTIDMEVVLPMLPAGVTFTTESGDMPTVRYIGNQTPIANAGLDQVVHAGTAVTLDGSGSSDPDAHYPLTYDWQIVSQPVESTAVLTLDPLALSGAAIVPDVLGDYQIRLVVTDSLGAASAPVTVSITAMSVNSPTCALTTPPPTCLGDPATFSASVVPNSGQPPYTFMWLKDSVPIAGASASTYTMPNVQPSDAGTYSVSIMGANGLSTSCSGVLTVLGPAFCSIATLDPLIGGTPVTFSGPAGMTHYAWSYTVNAITTPVAADSQMVDITLPLDGTITVALTVTAANDCRSSCLEPYSIIPGAGCNISSSQPGCPGVPQPFGVAGSSATPTSWTISWDPVANAGAMVPSADGRSVTVNSLKCVSFLLTANFSSSPPCAATGSFVDSTVPSLTSGSIGTCYKSVAEAEAAAIAVTAVTDSCPGTPTKAASTVGGCNAMITVTATDVCGNHATVTYNTRIDDTVPVIAALPDPTTIDCPATPSFVTATATDACGSSVTLTFNDVTTPGACPQEYSVTRTWTATDACGNSRTASQTITRVDTTPPAVAWPGDVNLTCADCRTDPANTGEPSATDTCSTPVISYIDTITGDCPKRIVRTWTVTDGCKTLSQPQIIQCLPSSKVVVTDSSLCSYDIDPTTTCKDFRLLFTQDPKNFPKYKVTASNPGQTYYNLFYNGTPGASVTFTITLPYPYVTQGAQPIHGYDWVDLVPEPNDASQYCIQPGTGFYVDSTQVTLASYTPRAIGSSTTRSVTLTVPATGFIYLNIHLDYGLKGSTGYTMDTADGNALDSAGLITLIPNHGAYAFSSLIGAETSADSLCNVNIFKKLPGVGGLAKSNYTTQDGVSGFIPVPGCTAVLKDAKGTVLSTGVTDADGWYTCNYKWTGKAATLYITLTPPGGTPQSKTVSLRSNGYAQIDFDL